jgi:hypothetical protein
LERVEFLIVADSFLTETSPMGPRPPRVHGIGIFSSWVDNIPDSAMALPPVSGSESSEGLPFPPGDPRALGRAMGYGQSSISPKSSSSIWF